MRGDVVEWATSSLGGIDEPSAMTLLFAKPCMAGEFGKNRFPDRPGLDQLFGALQFGIRSAIVGHAKSASGLFGYRDHGAGFGIIHGHGFLAQHMLSRTKRLNRLPRVKEHWSGDVNGLHGGIGESFVEGRPNARSVGRGFFGIARGEAVRSA